MDHTEQHKSTRVVSGCVVCPNNPNLDPIQTLVLTSIVDTTHGATQTHAILNQAHVALDAGCQNVGAKCVASSSVLRR